MTQFLASVATSEEAELALSAGADIIKPNSRHRCLRRPASADQRDSG